MDKEELAKIIMSAEGYRDGEVVRAIMIVSAMHMSGELDRFAPAERQWWNSRFLDSQRRFVAIFMLQARRCRYLGKLIRADKIDPKTVALLTYEYLWVTFYKQPHKHTVEMETERTPGHAWNWCMLLFARARHEQLAEVLSGISRPGPRIVNTGIGVDDIYIGGPSVQNVLELIELRSELDELESKLPTLAKKAVDDFVRDFPRWFGDRIDTRKAIELLEQGAPNQRFMEAVDRAWNVKSPIEATRYFKKALREQLQRHPSVDPAFQTCLRIGELQHKIALLEGYSTDYNSGLLGYRVGRIDIDDIRARETTAEQSARNAHEESDQVASRDKDGNDEEEVVNG